MYKIIRFIIEDIKSDIQTIIIILEKIVNKEPLLNPKQKEQFRKAFLTGWDGFFKKNWIFFLILILAFVSGFFVAAKYYQSVCNTYIIENFIKDNITFILDNYTYNY